MRRLVGHQAVEISLDGEGESWVVKCVLERVLGPVATLAACGELRAHVKDRLRAGALGFMTFEHYGAAIALRGAVRAISEQALEFVVLDGVQVAERRKAPRVALETSVRAALLADGVTADPIDTVTANLSVVGALLKRQPGLGEGPWQIELFLPGDATPVRCTGVLVRETPSHVGVTFADLPDADLTRLGEVIADPPPAVRNVRAETVSDETVSDETVSDETVSDASRADVVVSPNTDFELIADSGPDIVFIASAYGSAEYFNQRWVDYTGLPRTSAHGWGWPAILEKDQVDSVARGWREATAGKVPFEHEIRLRRFDGEFRLHRCRALPLVTADRQIVKWIGTFTDIEDQRRLEQSLRAAQRESAESLALLQILQAAAPVGFGFVDRDFRLVEMNETLAAANGAPRDQQLGHLLSETIPGLWSVIRPLCERVLETGEAVVSRETSREGLSDAGHVRTALTSLYAVRVDEEVVGIGVVVVDITERKAADLALRQMAEQDPQTGIYNRAKISRELQRVLGDRADDRDAGALLLLDIDNFHTINESDGHPAGDQLLHSVAQTLSGQFPDPAVVARVGGDEFAVIVPQTTQQQALTAAGELRALLRDLRSAPVHVSIGIASIDAGVSNREAIFANADTARRQAQDAGGDQAVVHTIGT
jgi:diguanylate cyclase (GGDEF)-like protein/PAS domain S-box-containing protein